MINSWNLLVHDERYSHLHNGIALTILGENRHVPLHAQKGVTGGMGAHIRIYEADGVVSLMDG